VLFPEVLLDGAGLRLSRKKIQIPNPVKVRWVLSEKSHQACMYMCWRGSRGGYGPSEHSPSFRDSRLWLLPCYSRHFSVCCLLFISSDEFFLHFYIRLMSLLVLSCLHCSGSEVPGADFLCNGLQTENKIPTLQTQTVPTSSHKLNIPSSCDSISYQKL